MTELNPSEAQRAMGYVLFAALSELDDCDDLVGDLAAANNAPEGAPAGTIARRPDGELLRFDRWRTTEHRSGTTTTSIPASAHSLCRMTPPILGLSSTTRQDRSCVTYGRQSGRRRL